MPTPKPLLLLDVDGPLNPWHQITRWRHKAGPAYHRVDFFDLPGFTDGLPFLFSPAHGNALRDLSDRYTLVWATTWVDDANRLISPLLGLPTDIPVIYWPGETADKQFREGRNGSWKTKWIAKWLADYAPGLPWAWVDDEVNRFDRRWIAYWYEPDANPPPHLMLRVDAYHGLNNGHFDALQAFADSLNDTSEPDA